MGFIFSEKLTLRKILEWFELLVRTVTIIRLSNLLIKELSVVFKSKIINGLKFDN